MILAYLDARLLLTVAAVKRRIEQNLLSWEKTNFNIRRNAHTVICSPSMIPIIYLINAVDTTIVFVQSCCLTLLLYKLIKT